MHLSALGIILVGDYELGCNMKRCSRVLASTIEKLLVVRTCRKFTVVTETS